jgi:hypothetical protein
LQVAGDIKIDSRVFAKNDGLVSDKFVEVSGKTPRQNISEVIVDDAEARQGPSP